MGKKERFEFIDYPRIIVINPKRLTSNGQLYTTQNFTDPIKMTRAFENKYEYDIGDKEIPEGWFWLERNAIVLGEGNHRCFIAYINDSIIEVNILGILPSDKKPIPFNVFARNFASGYGLEY